MADNFVEVTVGSKDDVNLAGPAAKVAAFGRLVDQTNTKLTQSYASSARAQKLLSDPLVKATQDTEAWSKASLDAAGKLTTLGDRTDRIAGKTDQLAGKADSAAKSMGALAGSGAGGGAAGGGMIAAIAAGVALSPVIATLAVGLGGLGLAALSMGKKSKQLAADIAPLKAQLAGFSKDLQPVLLQDFGKAAQVAGGLLADIEPVAKATGTALSGLLSQVGAEFQSGTWQNFFAFMARTAGPDINLLGKSFINLLDALPPLVQQLQPVSTSLLTITADATKLIDVLSHASQGLSQTGQHMNIMEKATYLLRTVLFAPGAGLLAALKLLHLTGGQSATSLADAGDSAAVAGPKFWSFSAAVKSLDTGLSKMVGNLLTLQGSQLSWQQSLQAAQSQLKSNNAGLESNSKNALANKQAVLSSTQAALSFAQQQLTLGKNIGGASRTVQDQISWLQKLHDKSQFVRDEIHALREEEAKLQAARINQTINVEGLGHWSVSQSLAPGVGHRRAKGGLIPGAGGGDTYPAMLTPGELVVPTSMVKAGAVDHLRGQLPGFASGGVVPTYAGAVGGLSPWIKNNDQATIRLIDEAVVKATVAGMKAAQAAASAAAPGSGGPASGAVRALQSYAASLFHFYGWGANQLPPLISLWNGESGWNPLARNPSSGAFGIPQALPPGKMGALAASGNAAAQIRWGEGYIHSVYGTPANAYGMWLSRSPHWYDNGGWLKPGWNPPMYNGTGRPEHLVPAGAQGQTVTLEVAPGAGGAIEQMFAEILRKFIRTRGGNVQQVLGRS